MRGGEKEFEKNENSRFEVLTDRKDENKTAVFQNISIHLISHQNRFIQVKPIRDTRSKHFMLFHFNIGSFGSSRYVVLVHQNNSIVC